MATTVTNNPFDVTQGSSNSSSGSSSGGGIIGGTIQNMATPVQPQSYTAQQREVNRPTETAAGQVESMLAKDSPLMQRARTLAMQNMNQRGLVNSSMSQGAGVAAMIDRITPIAQQDAQTYGNRALANQQAVNEANQFNVGQGNQIYSQKLDQGFKTAEREAGQQYQTSERLGSQTFTSSLENAKQNFTAAQAQLDRAQQTALADKSIEAQQALQLAQQQFTAAQSSLDREQQTALQEKQQSFQASQSSLDRAQQFQLQTAAQQFQATEAEKSRAAEIMLADKNISAQQALEKSRQEFQGAQSALDRAQQTSIAGMQIAAQKDLQTSQFAFQGEQARLEREQQMVLSQNQIQAQKDLQTSQQSFQRAQNELDRAQQSAMADKSIAAQQALQTAQQNFQSAQADLDRAQQANLQISQQNFAAQQQVKQNQDDLAKLNVQLNFQKAQLPATYAAQVSTTTMSGVNAIMADGNLNADQKKAAIDNVVNYANSQISWAEKFYGTEIPDITTPAPKTTP